MLWQLAEGAVVDLGSVVVAFKSLEGVRPKVKLVLRGSALGENARGAPVKANVAVRVWDEQATAVWARLQPLLWQLTDNILVDLGSTMVAFHSAAGGRPKVKMMLRASTLTRNAQGQTTKSNIVVRVYDDQAAAVWERLQAVAACDAAVQLQERVPAGV